MSRRNHRRRKGESRYRHPPGPIKRVVRGLSDRFGVGRGCVVACFILGIIFAPMLTLLIFLAAWVWVDNPERFERAVGSVLDKARGLYRSWTQDAEPGRSSAGPRPAYADGAEGVEEPAIDFPDLRRRFEDLERRAGRMEDYVTSEEFSLDREFRDIDDSR